MGAARSFHTLIHLFVSSSFTQSQLFSKLPPHNGYELPLRDFASATHFPCTYLDIDTCESSVAGYRKLDSIQLLQDTNC
jgi:hypothetical protein